MLKLKASAALTGTHLHVSRNNGPLLSDNERNCRVGLSALSARHKLNVFSQFEEMRIDTGEMRRGQKEILAPLFVAFVRISSPLTSQRMQRQQL